MKHANSRYLRSLLLTTLLVLVSLSICQVALAENMESGSYKIQFGNFNITSGEKSSSSYNVTDTVGQTGAGPYGQYGVSSYFVGGGFQYIYQIDKFNFRISKLGIDLGTLTPGLHRTDSHDISITSGGAHGYTVYAYQAHPLKNQLTAATIPNTTCDSGTCTYSTAGNWTNTTIPGFGYNMNGQDIPVDFTSSSYFRSFADASALEPMQIVMSSTNVGVNRTATVTYKAGVSGNQAGGNYSTYIEFIAVPGF